MQDKILSIELFFQPFMLLFKYNSDIQIMIMIVQTIVPTAYVHSHLLFSIFTSLAFFIRVRVEVVISILWLLLNELSMR
jgi:hypothetical protein